MTWFIDNITALYNSMSAFEVVITVIITLFVIAVVALYISYILVKRSIIRRITLSKRIATYTIDKVSEKTKDSAVRQKSEEMLRKVVGDERVDKIGDAIRPDEGADINQDVSELLEELGDDSLWFWFISIIYNRVVKKFKSNKTNNS